MIRQGATDNVLGFLSGPSGADVLRIKDSVGGGSWEGTLSRRICSQDQIGIPVELS